MSTADRDPIRVLHVDDPDYTELTATFLEDGREPFEVYRATTATEGLTMLATADDPIDCVVSDYDMPGMDGLEFLEAVREAYPNLPFILLTGQGSEAIASRAIAADVTGYLWKDTGRAPYERLEDRIVEAVEKRRFLWERYRELFEDVPLMYALTRNRGGEPVIEDCNERFCDTLGYPREALLGDSLAEHYTPESAADLLERRWVRAGARSGVRQRGAPVGRARRDGDRDAVASRPPDQPGRDRRRDAHAVYRRHRAQARTSGARSGPGDGGLDGRDAILNAQNRYVYANEAHADIYGYDDPDVFLGETWQMCYDEDQVEGLRAEVRSALDREGQWRGEAIGRRRDGSRFPQELSLTALPTGESIHVVRDITARKERERRRKTAQERFRSLAENTSLGVVTIDASSTVRFANDAVAELFGYTPEELVGESLATVIPDQPEPAHFEALGRYVETGEKALDWEWIELPARHRDGQEIQVGVSFGEFAMDGEHRFTGVIRDITDRHENERYRRRLYEITTDAELPADEQVREALALGCEYLGVESGFLTRIENGTQHIVEAHGSHEGIQPSGECPLSESYCRKTIEIDEPLVVRHASEDGWEGDPAYNRFGLETYVGAALTIDGEQSGTICFTDRAPRGTEFSSLELAFVDLLAGGVRGILERREHQRELQQQNERLDEFASVVSHDLRNPLTIADGYLEVARETGEDTHFEKVATAHGRMESIIEDVLTLARQGRVVGDTRSVSLASTIETAWNAVETIDAELVADGDLGAIEADESRLESLFENLFRNAIEHGGEDVTVRVGCSEGGFFVADDGPGIPENERESVFEHGHTTSEEGTGFGLSIVATIAEAHGWTISAGESESGGARFEIEF
jgi:PAS domain S-box-containing protein